MTGFVYKWTNKINQKWYIGSHKGTIDDGYRHSSQYLKLAEDKYGPANFTREILFTGDYEEDNIVQIEMTYLQKDDAANNLMSYNKTNMSGPGCWSEDTNAKRSQKLKGKDWGALYGPEKASKLRKNLQKRMTGCKLGPQSEIHKLRRSEALKGNTNGRGNAGNILTDEHKRNISIAVRNEK